LDVSSIVETGEELDTTAGKARFSTKFGLLFHSELAAAKEPAEGKLASGIKGVIISDDIRGQLGDDGLKDRQCDWETWLPVLFSMIAFDPAEEPLNDRVFSWCEWEVGIDMERLEMTEIGLDSLGLEVSGTEKGNPLHDRFLSCGKDGAVGVLVAVRDGKVNEALLSGGVGSSC
jgi:hypothetical protein